jgi:thiol:disulfide interchange protein DsbD
MDFTVENGGHVTYPSAAGQALAPRFEWNNEVVVINEIWPKPEKILDSDGRETPYLGYSEDFSVLFFVKKLKKDDQYIKCNVSYTVCGTFCSPNDKDVVIKPNGELKKKEIDLATKSNTSKQGLLLTLILSFLGGVVLNCMPCSFPIVSLKLFSILRSNSMNSSDARKNGLAFSMGCISTVLLIGLPISFLKSTTDCIGWGSFMQNPIIVSFLSLLFVLIALSMFGVIENRAPNIDYISKVSRKSKNHLLKSFFSGVITSITSSTCAGPFVGIALSSAILFQDFLESFLTFLFLGLGISFPVLVISSIPRIHKFFPKPGEWMVKLKESMGFLMLLSGMWMYSIVNALTGPEKLIKLLFIAIIFTFFVWMYGKSSGKTKHIAKYISIIGIIATLFCNYNIANYNDEAKHNTEESQNKKQGIEWTAFTLESVNSCKKSGRYVFINFTADWCLNCKLNEIVLNKPRVIETFKRNNVICIKADWTNKNTMITKMLESFGFSSIPLCVIYEPGKNTPTVIPGILSEKEIINCFGH